MENMFMSEGITQSDRMLYTPGSFAKNHLLYVQEVGKLQSIVPHVCRRENLDSYLIFEVLEGKGSITIKGYTTELRKGECAWIDCHNAFEHISSEEEPWKLVWVHFNGMGAKAFYELFQQNNTVLAFIPSESVGVEEIISKLLSCLKENGSELEMHSLLTQLVVGCTMRMRENGCMEEVREFINVNYKETGLYTLLVKRFQLEYEELDRQFYRSYGICIHDYILNRRFNAAKELLRFTILPIDEVIEESGIGNGDSFYRLFKENESMYPEDYRKKWAQWIKD